MQLVEIFIPIASGAAGLLKLEEIKSSLADKFGGVTAFVRAPAEGLWKRADQSVEADQIVVLEVMVDQLDLTWWRTFRRRLETDLSQEALLIRASTVEQL